jgi:hypothetical protein
VAWSCCGNVSDSVTTPSWRSHRLYTGATVRDLEECSGQPLLASVALPSPTRTTCWFASLTHLFVYLFFACVLSERGFEPLTSPCPGVSAVPAELCGCWRQPRRHHSCDHPAAILCGRFTCQTTTLTLDARNGRPRPGTTFAQYVWAVITLPDKYAVTNSIGCITLLTLVPFNVSRHVERYQILVVCCLAKQHGLRHGESVVGYSQRSLRHRDLCWCRGPGVCCSLGIFEACCSCSTETVSVFLSSLHCGFNHGVTMLWWLRYV